MGFADSFINYIKHIRNKLVILIKRRKMSQKEKDKYIELRKKYPEQTEEIDQELRKKKEEDEDHLIRNIILLSIFLFSSLLLIHILIIENVDAIKGIFLLFTFIFTFGIPYSAYVYGKLSSSIYPFFPLCFVFSLSNLKMGNCLSIISDELYADLFNYVFLCGFFTFFISLYSAQSIVKREKRDFNLEDYSYFKNEERRSIEEILDIVVSILKNNISEITQMRSVCTIKDGVVYDLGSDHRLFLIYDNEKLSFVVLRQRGKYIKKVEESQKVQNKIEYILKNVMRFVPFDEDEKNVLYNKQKTLEEKYIVPSKNLREAWEKSSIKPFLENNKIGIVILIGVLACIGYIRMFEIVDINLIHGIIIALITSFLANYFGKKR